MAYKQKSLNWMAIIITYSLNTSVSIVRGTTDTSGNSYISNDCYPHNYPSSNTNSNPNEVEYFGNVSTALSFKLVSSIPGRINLRRGIIMSSIALFTDVKGVRCSLQEN